MVCMQFKMLKVYNHGCVYKCHGQTYFYLKVCIFDVSTLGKQLHSTHIPLVFNIFIFYCNYCHGQINTFIDLLYSARVWLCGLTEIDNGFTAELLTTNPPFAFFISWLARAFPCCKRSWKACWRYKHDDTCVNWIYTKCIYNSNLVNCGNQNLCNSYWIFIMNLSWFHNWTYFTHITAGWPRKRTNEFLSETTYA